MVTIIDYRERTSEDGKAFFALILQGSVEIIQSEETGNFYATARKASISSTFDELTCKQLIGSKLPGTVEKIECEAYDYQIPGTEEMVSLTHTYRYNAKPSNIEENVFDNQLQSEPA